MTFSSGYLRAVRSGDVFEIWVRRVRCRTCPSHALLPSFCLARRLDAVEVIGPAVEAVATGASTRTVAGRLDTLFAQETVRDWWHRHRTRTAALLASLTPTATAAGIVVPSALDGTELDALEGLHTLAGPVADALGVGVWSAVSVLTAGQWLAAATDPPWTDQRRWLWMASMTIGRSPEPP